MHKVDHSFTFKILIGMLLGIVVGLAIRWIPFSDHVRSFLIDDILGVGGSIFLNIIKM